MALNYVFLSFLILNMQVKFVIPIQHFVLNHLTPWVVINAYIYTMYDILYGKKKLIFMYMYCTCILNVKAVIFIKDLMNGRDDDISTYSYKCVLYIY